MSTLEELLAFLPDNTNGDISAEDMRQVVTALWTETTKVRSPFSYQWDANDLTPNAGHFTLDQGWSLASAVLIINKTTDDGQTLPASTTVNLFGASVVALGVGSVRLEGVVVDAAVDAGTRYEVPFTVRSVAGAPSDNDDTRVIFSWTSE